MAPHESLYVNWLTGIVESGTRVGIGIKWVDIRAIKANLFDFNL